jgi:hypothetical protein
VTLSRVSYEGLGEINGAGEANLKLDLPSFDAVQQPLQNYLDSIHNYHKNEYPDLPLSLRNKIAQSWKKSFEMWGYSTNLAQ